MATPSAANTFAFYYFDKKVLPKKCKDDKDRINTECKPEDHKLKEQRTKKKGGLLSRLKVPGKPKKGQGTPDKNEISNEGWIDDHCEFLLIKPSSPKQMFDDLTRATDEIITGLGTDALSKLQAQAEEKLASAVKKKLAKVAVKQGVIRVGSFLFTPAVGVAVNILMTADGANDFKNAAKEFPQLQKDIEAASKKLESAREEIKKLQSELDKYRDPKKPGGINEQALVSDMMYAAAETNPCISARRCALVPFNQTHGTAPRRGKGCCPGQSGHHVLPSAMFAHCDKYDENNALTICVEGTTNSHGSHRKIHENLKSRLVDARRSDRTVIKQGEPMSKASAIEHATQSVITTFPLARCNADCIRAQLTENYKYLNNCEPKNESGAAGTGVVKVKVKAKSKGKNEVDL